MVLFDPRSTLRPFRHRAFAFYSLGNGVSLIGTWMQRVAAGWLTWQLTESGGWLGIIAAAEFLPALVIAPFAGAAADRWDRITLMKICQVLSAGLALVMFGLTLTDTMTIWLLLVFTILLGIVTSFVQPARLAFVPSLVPRAELGSAVAINSVIVNLARFIGPLIAGLIIATSGVPGAFFANAVSFAIFFTVLTQIRLPEPATPRSAPSGGFIRQLADGLRYTAAHTGIASVLLLLIAMAIGARSLVELLPGFAGAIFDTGAPGLAVLTSSVGAGAIIGGVWVSGRTTGHGYFAIALWNSVAIAVSVMLFSVTDAFWVAIAFLTAYGFAVSAAGICLQTAVQLAVDRDMAGRVLSLYGLIFRGTPAVGALIIGGASERLGLQMPMFFGGVLLAIACFLTFLRRRAIVASLEAPNPAQPT